MLQIDYYLEDDSYEIRVEKTLTVEEATDIYNQLLQQGYTFKKEGVLSNGTYKAVFKYTGYFVP
jgi:hypothetical protein